MNDTWQQNITLASFRSAGTFWAHLFGHVPGEEEVRQRSEEEEAGRHQEAKPPGSHPAQVLMVQLDLVWKKKRAQVTSHETQIQLLLLQQNYEVVFL